jgi:hypothetical protein
MDFHSATGNFLGDVFVHYNRDPIYNIFKIGMNCGSMEDGLKHCQNLDLQD